MIESPIGTAHGREQRAHTTKLRSVPNGRQIIVLANRQPYSHERDCGGHVRLARADSGVVNAVEPLVVACGGMWIAHGSGSADRDQPDRLLVPPDAPTYRLRRVWLSSCEERGYYDGFANGALWPLCHRTPVQPKFRAEDFSTYRDVNARFADAVAEEAESDDPAVFVQDYHFALAPLMIRQRLPRSTISTFWHVPWPNRRVFALCPWRREVLAGLLGSDIISFQTVADSQRFTETVEQTLTAEVDRGEGVIIFDGHHVRVRAHPASIEWPGKWAHAAPVAVCRHAVRRDLRLDPRVLLGIGVDRLDYTKGIEQKFLIVERLLERHSEFRGRFVFVQLVQASRQRVPEYRRARVRVFEAAERVNRQFSAGEYRPALALEAHHRPASIARHFRAADVCFVGSLHDGMNLVSKEFVAARDDEQGVLVLSKYAGAACELTDAVLVDPYETDVAANALAAALRMDRDDQRNRMRRLRDVVAHNDAHNWAYRIVTDACAISHTPMSALEGRHEGLASSC